MYVLEDELVLSRELAQEFRGKKSLYNFGERGRQLRKHLKMSLGHAERRKLEVKAWLELNLATWVKDNIFINYIYKRRTKENLYSLLQCPSPRTRKRLRYFPPPLPQSSALRLNQS